MAYYLEQLTPTYYDTLIDWEMLDALIEKLDEHEKSEAYGLIFSVLDNTVMETVLSHLDRAKHEEWLLLVSHQYHEPSLLTWLDDQHPGMSEKVQEAIKSVKSAIHQELFGEAYSEYDSD